MCGSRIVRRVAVELANPAANEGRHCQMRSSILSLLEVGLSSRAVFTQFLEMYDEDVPDSEVEAIIKRGVAKAGKSRDASQLRRSDKQDPAQDSLLLLGHLVANSSRSWELRQKYTPWCLPCAGSRGVWFVNCTSEVMGGRKCPHIDTMIQGRVTNAAK